MSLIFFLRPGLALIFSMIAFSAYAAEYEYNDIHIHVGTSGEEIAGINKEVFLVTNRKHFKNGLIISPTYHDPDNEKILLNHEINTHEYRMGIFQAINDSIELNRRINPWSDNSHLLCGTYLYDETSVNSLESCMNLPHAIGAKIRGGVILADDVKLGAQDKTYQDVYMKSLKKLLSLLNARHGVLLAHFDDTAAERSKPLCTCRYGSDDCLFGSVQDTGAFIKLIKNYPNVVVILAHSATLSFIGLNGLELIAKSSIAPQIYIDTSASLLQTDSIHFYPKSENQTRIDRILRTWKTFGVDHVLYGSDYMPTLTPDNGLDTAALEKTAIEASKVFTDREKRMIFTENYETLMQKLTK